MNKSQNFGFNLPSRDTDDIVDINQISENFKKIDDLLPNVASQNNICNALKGTKSGTTVLATDVSPLEHNLTVKLTSDTITDFSGVTVSRYGKNLFNPQILTDAGFVLNDTGYYEGEIKALNDTYGAYSGSLPLPNFAANTQYSISFEAYTEIDVLSYGGVYIRITYTDDTDDYLVISTTSLQKYTLVTSANKSVQKISAAYGDQGEALVYIKNFCVCVGTDPTYEEYAELKTYASSAGGIVDDLTSLYPSVTLMTDNSDVIIHCEYNKDINTLATDQTYNPDSYNAQSGVALAPVLQSKADAENVYTKAEIDELSAILQTSIFNGIASDYYNAVKTDEMFSEVDNKIGDIETALDGIIAIQESYIGGDSV